MEYGLIGAKLGHSYSKIIHEMLCGYHYDLCPLPTEEEARAMALLRRYKLPFGVACPCTAENADQVGTEEYYDHLIGLGAKFCWFFTCPAVDAGDQASLLQLSALHQRVKTFRKTKPMLSLDFWDRPSPSAVAEKPDALKEEAQA